MRRGELHPRAYERAADEMRGDANTGDSTHEVAAPADARAGCEMRAAAEVGATESTDVRSRAEVTPEMAPATEVTAAVASAAVTSSCERCARSHGETERSDERHESRSFHGELSSLLACHELTSSPSSALHHVGSARARVSHRANGTARADGEYSPHVLFTTVRARASWLGTR